MHQTLPTTVSVTKGRWSRGFSAAAQLFESIICLEPRFNPNNVGRDMALFMVPQLDQLLKLINGRTESRPPFCQQGENKVEGLSTAARISSFHGGHGPEIRCIALL